MLNLIVKLLSKIRPKIKPERTKLDISGIIEYEESTILLLIKMYFEDRSWKYFGLLFSNFVKSGIFVILAGLSWSLVKGFDKIELFYYEIIRSYLEIAVLILVSIVSVLAGFSLFALVFTIFVSAFLDLEKGILNEMYELQIKRGKFESE